MLRITSNRDWPRVQGLWSARLALSTFTHSWNDRMLRTSTSGSQGQLRGCAYPCSAKTLMVPLCSILLEIPCLRWHEGWPVWDQPGSWGSTLPDAVPGGGIDASAWRPRGP